MLVPRGRNNPIHGTVVAAEPEPGLRADHRPQRAAAGEARGMNLATLRICAGPQMCVSEPRRQRQRCCSLGGMVAISRVALGLVMAAVRIYGSPERISCPRPGQEVGKLPPNPQRVLN